VAKEVSAKAEAELLDLRDYPLPFYDEPGSARYMPDRKPVPEVQKWLDKIAEFDGYVLVTPEYNRSTSAVLKNAIDMLGHEADDKPAALVGHGSSGGAQAIANLRMVLPGVGMVSIPQALFFSDHLAESIDDEGGLKDEIKNRPYGPQATLEAQVDSLLWYAGALKAARG
jgi:NAD(P)H-dependent FMN reductase